MGFSSGIDIIEINRIKKAIDKWDKRFIQKVYTSNEIDYCESKNSLKYQHYAVRFAAKEAVSKALGTGFSNNISFSDIEIIKNQNGKPSVLLHNYANEVFTNRGITALDITLSHCKDYAVAVAFATSEANIVK